MTGRRSRAPSNETATPLPARALAVAVGTQPFAFGPCGFDRKAASASSSASLISVLRKNGMTETPWRTNCLTTAGVRSVRSTSAPGFVPL